MTEKPITTRACQYLEAIKLYGNHKYILGDINSTNFSNKTSYLTSAASVLFAISVHDVFCWSREASTSFPIQPYFSFLSIHYSFMRGWRMCNELINCKVELLDKWLKSLKKPSRLVFMWSRSYTELDSVRIVGDYMAPAFSHGMKDKLDTAIRCWHFELWLNSFPHFFFTNLLSLVKLHAGNQ